MITVPGSTVEIPARAQETRPTRDAAAWMGTFLTVELYRPIEAMRVARRRLGLVGDWFALGDWIQTRSRYRALHALPQDFLFQAVAVLQPGTIVNVGTCGPLFRLPGGGLQAEFLEGPLPILRPSDATWVDYVGHA